MAEKYNIKYFYDIKDRSNFKANPDYKGVCHVALAQVRILHDRSQREVAGRLLAGRVHMGLLAGQMACGGACRTRGIWVCLQDRWYMGLLAGQFSQVACWTGQCSGVFWQ